MLITAVDSFLLLLIERIGIRHLEAAFGVMIGIMAVSFGFMAELAHVSFPSIAKGATRHAHGMIYAAAPSSA